MLVKFFTNSHATAYLRGLAEEFGESTNAIRHELNNLSRAGYIIPVEEGRMIWYRANTQHPLYNEIKSLVHKYLGLDTIVDKILSKLGDLDAAYIVGDYAMGRDSGTIHLVLVGSMNRPYLNKLLLKAKQLLNRNIEITLMRKADFDLNKKDFQRALLVFQKD